MSALEYNEVNLIETLQPQGIHFDNIFSNDLAEEQEYDLIVGAEEDDMLLQSVAESDIFYENGNEINYDYVKLLREDGEEVDDDEEASIEDEDEEEPDTDNVSSNDVDSNAGEDAGDDISNPPAETGTPTISIDIDADDVNINAEAPKNEANLLNECPNEEDFHHHRHGKEVFHIDNVENLNIGGSSGCEAPTTEPAAPQTPDTCPNMLDGEPKCAPSDDTSSIQVDIEVTPNDDAPESSPEDGPNDNLLDSDGENNDFDSSDDAEVSNDNMLENDEDTPIDNNEEDDDLSEACCKGSGTGLDNVANTTKSDSHHYSATTSSGSTVKSSDNDEVNGALGEANLLEDDINDPTLGEAPETTHVPDAVPDPKNPDTSTQVDYDQANDSNREEAMGEVDDLNVVKTSEANLLEGNGAAINADTPSPDPEEVNALVQGEQDLENMEHITAGDWERVFSAAPDASHLHLDGTSNEDINFTESNLLETEDNNDDEERLPDSNDMGDNDIKKVPDVKIEANLLEEGQEASINFNNIEKKDNENKFDDSSVYGKDGNSLDIDMNNAPIDASRSHYHIPDQSDSTHSFDDQSDKRDIPNMLDNAPIDPSSKEYNAPEQIDTEPTPEDNTPDIDLSRAMNSAEEDPSKNDDGKPQESANLLEDGDQDIIPNEYVADGNKLNDQDGLEDEKKNYPKDGTGELVGTYAESNLLEQTPYMQQVENISDDDEFNDEENQGLVGVPDQQSDLNELEGTDEDDNLLDEV